jgi:hypothetical protein
MALAVATETSECARVYAKRASVGMLFVVPLLRPWMDVEEGFEARDRSVKSFDR